MFENGGANALPEQVQVSTSLAPTVKETDSIRTTYLPYGLNYNTYAIQGCRQQ